jgi:glycosyltransferase involved in cell wall biosynthesis
VAHHLAPRHAITVLTSCASDYVSWRNTYPPGESRDQSIVVRRFPVRTPRRLHAFADLSDQVFDGGASRERQEAWFRANGPEVPDLLDHLREHGPSYDLVLFWTFRYFPSFFGVPLVRDRAVLVPTAEEDRAIDLDILGEFFTLPAGYLFLTPEEQTVVASRASRPLPRSAVIGMGLDLPEPTSDAAVLTSHGIPSKYLLYLGRVDRNKGCHTLLEHFETYADSFPSDDLTLILAGPLKLRVPDHPRIEALGYVSDDLRAALLTHARAMVVPSPYESLSIALLEGWNYGLPALVNARCAVLKGQVRRANGGIPYRSGEEFCEALRYFETHEAERRVIGEQGRAYVDREYRWPIVIERVERLLAEVHGRRA